MLRAVRFLPLCLARAILFPALGVIAIVATIAYVASKDKETAK